MLGPGDRAVIIGVGASTFGVIDGEAWERVVWWAAPAAADLSLWMSLLREYRPDLALLYGRVRDANALVETTRCATGDDIHERPDDAVGTKHAPGYDSLVSAWACARALRTLD